MKIGPIHLIRDLTYRKLQRPHAFWHRIVAGLSAQVGTGTALADSTLAHSNGLIHCPADAQISSSRFEQPDNPDDPACREAAARVTAAYSRSQADGVGPPATCMWEQITHARRDFVHALTNGDVGTVGRILSDMFQTKLIWGLGKVDDDHPRVMRENPKDSFLHLEFSDSIVNLAEAVGALRVTCPVQDNVGHLQALNVDHANTLADIHTRLGFEVTFPPVAASFGFDVAGQLVTLDSLLHGYAAHRICQLGVPKGSSIVEIGGGYGCLALLGHRAGYRDYTIVDLPWVNAIQGYFLLRTLPADQVRLYGEPGDGIRVLPYWMIDELPNSSAGLVVNTNSLPEMGLETARGYIRSIHQLIGSSGRFLSINQEAKVYASGYDHQLCVRELVEEHGDYLTESRNRSWMWNGYVEEVFRTRSEQR